MRSIFIIFQKLRHTKSLDSVINFGHVYMCVVINMYEYVIVKVLIFSNFPE